MLHAVRSICHRSVTDNEFPIHLIWFDVKSYHKVTKYENKSDNLNDRRSKNEFTIHYSPSYIGPIYRWNGGVNNC